MDKPNFKLPNAPIVEAVLDIECDLKPGQQLADLEEPAREIFRESYPKLRQNFFHEHQIEQKPDAPLEVLSRQGLQALQFLNNDEKQLIQIRRQGYSFNRLAPYSSLDDYLPEIERTWRLYVNLVNPVQVRLIRLRYINRILLPMEEGLVELDDFFKTAPHLPEEDKLQFVGFLNQHVAVEKDTGNQVNILLTTQPFEGDKLPVIFDNTVVAQRSGEPSDWTFVLTTIGMLRELKNRIFRDALTEKCLDLFQQQ